MDYLKRAKRFRTKKKFGQNFLIEESVIDSIIENADLSCDDTVFEIGPGIGFVTERLAAEAKKVFAVEIDYDAINELVLLPFDNIEIIDKDILKTDIYNLSDKKLKVIANIPYYITSPILVHLLGEMDDLENKNRTAVNEIILMVQYEVAKRIVANHNSQNKEYGTLSVLCNYWAETEIIQKVPADCFWPAPKVDSALIKLIVREKPLVSPKNPKLFRKVVQACFGMRRKNIKNSLVKNGFDKEIVEKALKNLGIDERVRGETLSIQKFSDLSDEIGA